MTPLTIIFKLLNLTVSYGFKPAIIKQDSLEILSSLLFFGDLFSPMIIGGFNFSEPQISKKGLL